MHRKPQHQERKVREKTQLTMYSMVTPVATRLRTKLNYADQIVPAGLPYYEYLFNLNSLFDPDRTATGHQPLGFDQLTTLYGRYRVYNVKYELTWIPTTSDPCMIVAIPTNSTSGIGSLATALESYSAKHSRIGNVYNSMSVRGTVDLAVLNGKTLAQYRDDDTTQAATTGSPSELLILHAMFGSVSGTNVTGYGTVKLTFDCEFSDPHQLSAS